MLNTYNFEEIEKKWQKIWEENECFKAEDFSPKPKYYSLVEFPYPSGVGMHLGHVKAYMSLETLSRKKRLEGYNVLFPMGWDAFGLPAENFAIKHNVNPEIAVKENISRMKEQLKRVGFSFDWSREIATTDESFYKWTQWIFLQLYKKGLAYRSNTLVNYCPKCDVVLSNEESQGGVCDRCGSEVVQKKKDVWFLKIRDYADKILDGLNNFEAPDRIKEEQKNWIGKSVGTSMKVKLSTGDYFEIFTTCIETVFGITYFVLAPEHELVNKIKDKIENYDEVLEYIEKTSRKSEFERTELVKEKTGVCLKGIYAINPVNNTKVPVYISDYVLANYGSGAVMAVPAHDQRDYEFAKKFNIPLIQVIEGGNIEEKAFEKAEYLELNAKLINSGEFSGLTVLEAKEKLNCFLEKNNLGHKEINFKMRDWAFNRQRYWGEPFPIVYCEKCGIVPVPEEDLPVKLPKLKEYKPGKNGESPLADAHDFVNCKCPKCGGKAKRETDTMPQWAGSSWYYLRYMDPHNDKQLASPEKLKYWGQIDWYNGGMEHVSRHLIYASFWNRFLYDIGVVPNPTPFKKRTAQGLVLAEDGSKMSKSAGTAIDPMEIVEKYGADVLRLYILFMADYEGSAPWNDKNISGCKRFIERIIRMQEFLKEGEIPHSRAMLYNDTIKKVSEDIEETKYNTAIASLMSYVNEIYAAKEITKEEFRTFLILLYPFAPHIAEELNESLNLGEMIAKSSWPKIKDVEIKRMINLPIQINGKVKTLISMEENLTKEEVLNLVLKDEKVINILNGASIKKEIYVPNRILNLLI